MAEDAPLLLHINKVGEILGLSPYLVRGLINEGALTATEVRCRTYVVAESLQSYVDSLKAAS